MRRRPTSKASAAKIAAPPISDEAGREYCNAAEAAITDATADELRQLVVLFATYADGLAAKVFDRNECARQLLGWGKGHDRGRNAYFQAITITHKVLSQALSLSPISDFERREELLKLATHGLAQQLAIGCVEVTWPDEALFPLRETKAN